MLAWTYPGLQEPRSARVPRRPRNERLFSHLIILIVRDMPWHTTPQRTPTTSPDRERSSRHDPYREVMGRKGADGWMQNCQEAFINTLAWGKLPLRFPFLTNSSACVGNDVFSACVGRRMCKPMLYVSGMSCTCQPLLVDTGSTQVWERRIIAHECFWCCVIPCGVKPNPNPCPVRVMSTPRS